MTSASDPKRELFRHALATLAYRSAKTLRNAPPPFAEFSAGSGTRTPAQILAHMRDLLDWALSTAQGKQTWRSSTPLAWDQEAARFFASLKALDDFLASDDTVHAPLEKLFQGPIADALTHVGQIAMLRRLAGVSMKGENYFVAEIAAGHVGVDQAAPKQQF